MKKNTILFTFISMIFIVLFKFQTVTGSIREAVALFESKVFPSLFPFMVLSPFLINYGFLSWTKSIFGPIMKKVFRLNENTSYIFAMGLISGFPSSAIYSKDLYQKGLICKDEVAKTLLFTHFSNPIFILTMVQHRPILVLAVHYISAIFIGILIRGKKTSAIEQKDNNGHPDSFFNTFFKSIKNSIESSLFILGVIVFFFMINSVINLPISNIILELSQGISYISDNIINQKLQAAMCGMLLSFGGLSVHVQTYGILSDLKISYFPYLKTRLFHALLSFVVIWLIY